MKVPGLDPDTGVIGHLIGGAYVVSESGDTFETEDPATGEVLATLALGGPAEVDRAVAAAADAARAWAALAPEARAATLRRVGELIHAEAEAIALVESRDTGKPLAQARGEIHGAADSFIYYAGLAELPRGTVYPAQADHLIYSARVPYGVVGAISPWNYPFDIAAGKVAPALAAGNSVVLKAAEQTPLSALWLAHAVHEAGVPAGVLNLVHGDGVRTGAALVAHPDVPKITFTGSTATGRRILRDTADHIKSVHLELGGKSPNIVFEDADLEQAAAGSLFTAFKNAGQICTSGSRLLVQASIAEEFVASLTQRARDLVVGDPMAATTQVGPLVSAAQHERVSGYVAAGLADGADLALGGRNPHQQGYYLEPTIFTNVTPDMRIAQEEIFGPVLSVLTFTDEQDAIRIANGVAYGLAAAVWTQDLGRCFRVAEALEAGIVWTNCTQHLPTRVPYEGHKTSGLGEDQGGLEVLREYTRLKTHAVHFGRDRMSW